MKNKNKGFTLIELLTVVIIMGLVMVIAIPSVRNLTYNNSQKKYRIHEKIVDEAVKLYVKNYRGEFNNETADCFNIPYQALLDEELVEEEGITCSGSVIVRKRISDGYNYEYYLNCHDEAGTLMHESDPIPLACKGVNGKFKVEYTLKQDNENGEPYKEGEWAKHIYAKYNSSSPYNLPIKDMEYSLDFINWIKMENEEHTYTNYNGNIFVRAVDEGENISEATRHLIKGDSLGPEFRLVANEDVLLSKDELEVSIDKNSVKDNGVGVDVNGEIYSFDKGESWVGDTSKVLAVGTETPIYAKDHLGNISIVTTQTLHACTSTALKNGTQGTAKAKEILTGKEAWVNGTKVIGSMPNNHGVQKTMNPGDIYMIPEGYHDGTGKITVTTLDANTKATAAEGNILKGKNAWVNGKLLEGTMPDRGNLDWKPTKSTTYEVPAGYYSGGTLDSSDAYTAGYNEGVIQGKSSSTVTLVQLGTAGASPNAGTSTYNLTELGYNTTGVTESNFFATMDLNVTDRSETGMEYLKVSHSYANGTVTFHINGSHSGNNTSLGGTITFYFIKVG